MHVETMSRSPIGMFLPLDQQPSMQSNPHTFPPFPSPESECFPQWLQFDSPAASSHYSIPAFGGDGTNSPAEAPQTFIFPPTSMETSGGLEGAHTSAPWDDERKPLPSFPATLGRAKRRALDLACITRATPTGLHPPYSPGDSNAVCGFSALPQSSGCYGHLSANDYCWGEQVNDNQVVVSQSESLCMLVDSQESYPRVDDYAAAADGNVVVMEVYADNHAQQQPSFINSYSLSTGMCEEVKAEGLFGAEFAGEGPTVGSRRNGEERRGISISSDPWGESDVEEDVEEEEEEEEEGEGEEEEEVEELRQAVEEEVVVEDGEEEKGRRRGGWKRGRRTRRRNRRKQPNDSDEDGSNVADDVFLPGEDDGECSLLNIPTTLVCRWSDCNAIFGDQSALVKHIEKNHVDARSRGGGSGGSASKGSQSTGGSLGEEFACYWHLCPRRTRPFNARYKLLIHMRVHSGDKPNKCPYEGCPKAFSRLENLKIHQRSHTGERPYTCQFPLCPKAFSNSSDRAKHQRTHFDTKPYACQVAGCSKRYTDPSSLRKHVKNHSPKDQTQARRKAKSVDSSSSLHHSKESKCPPSTPPAVTHLTGGLFQDCNSEISSSSTSVKGTFGIQEQPFEDENTGENLHPSNQQFVDDSYTNGDLIGYSSQEVEDDLFFDCFQSLDSMKPLLHAEKESASSSDLQSSTQFELSLDLDCGEVQQDFLEIGVLEKWGVTGTNMVACCTTDDALDSDFLTIS